MKKNILIAVLALSTMLTMVVGCNQQNGSTQPAPAPKAETEIALATEITNLTESTSEEETKAKVNEAALPQLEVEEVIESESKMAADEENKEVIEIKEDIENKDTVKAEVTADEAEDYTKSESGEVVQFTAITGLDKFSAYRLNFESNFDGVQNSRPTTGDLNGIFEVTENPEALHWRVNMNGDTFKELSLLGGKMELYDINNTIYIQNPTDNTWIGMPAMLMDSMLPNEMYHPEDTIELPTTARLHPGEETINGVTTQRYTFGKDDMTRDMTKLDSAEGTIWVAVDGNYVVKYNALISGQFDNLVAGDMALLDAGTIKMGYEVTDINGDFSINAPEGAQAIDLASLLFN